MWSWSTLALSFCLLFCLQRHSGSHCLHCIFLSRFPNNYTYYYAQLVVLQFYLFYRQNACSHAVFHVVIINAWFLLNNFRFFHPTYLFFSFVLCVSFPNCSSMLHLRVREKYVLLLIKYAILFSASFSMRFYNV